MLVKKNPTRRAALNAGVACLAGVALASCAGESTAPSPAPDGPTVSMDDFRPLEGDWVGTLTYLDYTSQDRRTINTAATIAASSDRTLAYTIRYPDEPWENTKATITISRDGRKVDGHSVTARTVVDDETLQVTTLHAGKDDDKPAQIQLVYTIAADAFLISKNIQFTEGDAFTNRNVYAYTRRTE